MNARLYDPAIGRFLSPDPYVQAPGNSQNYNRYSYCLNNPLKFTDPSGEISLGEALWWWYCTDAGYETQKYLLPFAFRFKMDCGNERNMIGIEASFGIPQIFPVAYRYNVGAAYYKNDYDNSYSGWESSYGGEWAVGYPFAGYLRYGGTSYNRKGTEFDQVRYTITIGNPLINIQNENDARIKELYFLPWLPVGMSDKHLTEEIRINLGNMQIGLTLFTGRGYIKKDGDEYYTEDEGKDYRAGIIYLKIGNLKFGYDSEYIRDKIQNTFHEKRGDPKYKVIKKKPHFVWQFG